MIGVKTRVPMETYVERELVGEVDYRLNLYRFRMVWEGTVIAEARVPVSKLIGPAAIDGVGISALMRSFATL